MAGAVKRSFSEFRNLSETSRFRILYIVTLFFCYVSFLQVPAYVCLFFLYFWGVKIAYRSVVKRQCLSRLRFGFWILLFLGLNIVTMIAHFNMSSLLFFTVSTGANTAMFLHVSPYVCCELLSIKYLWNIKYSWSALLLNQYCVVNCFQLSIFEISNTAYLLLWFASYRLWIAFN